MTEVVWENLAKAVADLTKISEEINAKVLEHNNDPSAHGQEAESLWEHRLATLFDHALSYANCYLDLDVTRASDGLAWIAQDAAKITISGPTNFLIVFNATICNRNAGSGGRLYLESYSVPSGATLTRFGEASVFFGDTQADPTNHYGVTLSRSVICAVDTAGDYVWRYKWIRENGGTMHILDSQVVVVPLGGGTIQTLE